MLQRLEARSSKVVQIRRYEPTMVDVARVTFDLLAPAPVQWALIAAERRLGRDLFNPKRQVSLTDTWVDVAASFLPGSRVVWGYFLGQIAEGIKEGAERSRAKQAERERTHPVRVANRQKSKSKVILFPVLRLAPLT